MAATRIPRIERNPAPIGATGIGLPGPRGFDPGLYRRPAIEDIELGYRMTRAGIESSWPPTSWRPT